MVAASLLGALARISPTTSWHDCRAAAQILDDSDEEKVECIVIRPLRTYSSRTPANPTINRVSNVVSTIILWT